MNWLEKFVTQTLKHWDIEEAWITDISFRQKNNGDVKEVRLTLGDIGPNATAKVVVIAVPQK